MFVLPSSLSDHLSNYVEMHYAISPKFITKFGKVLKIIRVLWKMKKWEHKQMNKFWFGWLFSLICNGSTWIGWHPGASETKLFLLGLYTISLII